MVRVIIIYTLQITLVAISQQNHGFLYFHVVTDSWFVGIAELLM